MKIEDKRKLIELEQQYLKETKYYKARLKWEEAKKLNPDAPCLSCPTISEQLI